MESEIKIIYNPAFNLNIFLLKFNALFKNVAANFLGCGWNGLLIVFATPWYVSLLGMEGYGLVGFWFLLQVLFSLFDLGLGATIAREFATSTETRDISNRKRDLLRTFEYIYWPLALLLSLTIFISADLITNNWLNLNVISKAQTVKSVQYMAFALGLQFPCALYSFGLMGLQRQFRMNAFQIFGNSLRHGGGVTALLLGADVPCFFLFQAAVAGFQTLLTMASVWRLLNIKKNRKAVFRFNLLQEVWRFSTGMALTMIAGLTLTNVDRLFLSKLLAIEELGKYTLAWTVASFLQIGIQPFYRAYFPRFTELHTLGDKENLSREYYQSCRLTAWIIIPFFFVGFAFAPEIFLAWIGKSDSTIVAIFRWLLVGVAGSGLMWMPAAFQQAHGWTRLHASMIAGAVCLGVPCLWVAINHWGAVGATTVWVLHGLSDITLGLWLMHRRLLPGQLKGWYRTVILQPVMVCIPIVALSWFSLPADMSRWSIVAWLAMTSMLMAFSVYGAHKFSKYNEIAA